MPKLNTTVKSVRIENEKLVELEKRLAGRSINSWLNEQITEFLGGKPAKIGCELSSETMGSIREMLGFSGMTFDDLLKDINEKLESGELMLDEGCTRVQMPAWAEAFEEACHDLCIPVEKAAENAIKALKKG